MVIHDMTREMNTDLLKRTHFGRIACSRDAQPYIVPFFFAYHERLIYSFGTAGTRIEWMRANPLVCVEVEQIASRHEWQTVLIFGRYQELPETPEFHEERVFAHNLLARTEIWWEPGYVKTLHQGLERPLQHIYFRISIDQINGHQGSAE